MADIPPGKKLLVHTGYEKDGPQTQPGHGGGEKNLYSLWESKSNCSNTQLLA